MAEKVGFVPRLIAFIIDAIVIGIISAVLNLLLPGDPTTGSVGLGSALGGILNIIYFIYFWGSTGQTLGMRVMNIRVVSTDGGPVGYGKAIVRYIGYIIATAVIFIGLLWIIWDANKQGWHDKIAGTYVVKA